MQFEEFVPETHDINLEVDLEDSGNISSHFDQSCRKKENHGQYIKLKDLTLVSLPSTWQDPRVLKDLKHIGDCVVHLTVLQLSPSRQEDHNKTSASQCALRHGDPPASSHEGSGFLTFNKRYGPVVHTSKHVVRDRFEAERTVVRLFYDDDKDTGSVFSTLRWLRDKIHKTELSLHTLLQQSHEDYQYLHNRTFPDPLLYGADGRYFESFIYSDYTAFSCDVSLDDRFSEKARQHPSFSYVKVGNKQLVLGPQLDVAVISHPHGMPKAIAFGKMKPIARLLPAMYTAATCPGSSGAPFIRLHSNTSYKSPDANILTNTIRTNCEGEHFACWIVNTFSLCEDFLLYWMLLMFDHEQVEPFIKAHLTMFTIIVPLSGVIFSFEADFIRMLWTGFWMHITCSVLHWFVQGPHITPVLCGTFSAAVSVLMCVIGWALLHLLCFLYPWNFICISLLWFLTLLVEWKFSSHRWFFGWFIKTFRIGKVIPAEETCDGRISESQSFSSFEHSSRWTRDCRERFWFWLQDCHQWVFRCALSLQKTTVLTLMSMMFSINWTLFGIMWTSVCLYICSSCVRGATSSIPAVEDVIFKMLAQHIDKLKQTRMGRYLHHFFPIPSDIRGAFYLLFCGSPVTETIYRRTTFFLGPSILLVVWTALLIEPPPFIAVILFLLPRRPFHGLKPSYSSEFSVSESTDQEEPDSPEDSQEADLEATNQSPLKTTKATFEF